MHVSMQSFSGPQDLLKSLSIVGTLGVTLACSQWAIGIDPPGRLPR